MVSYLGRVRKLAEVHLDLPFRPLLPDSLQKRNRIRNGFAPKAQPNPQWIRSRSATESAMDSLQEHDRFANGVTLPRRALARLRNRSLPRSKIQSNLQPSESAYTP